jgi:hypothetical protein
MYHRARFLALGAAVAVTAWGFGLGELSAQVAGETVSRTPAGSRSAGLTYPLPPQGKMLQQKPTAGETYQVDNTPLGDRKPLLLVHGGAGEGKPLCRWGRVIDRFSQDPDFNKTYKIFLYRYNTSVSLRETVPQFQAALLALHEQVGRKPLTILTLSMGGNLCQGALVDPAVDRAVELVLAMGTPFHGSPLFSADWFQYSLDKTRLMPWARPVHSVDLKLYFSMHKNYLEDLKWDNLDGLIPEVGRFKARLPIAPRGVLTPDRDANPELARINTEGGLDKSKFIVYGGYLINPYLLTPGKRKLEKTILAPYRFVTVRLATQVGREHAALKLLNQEMGRLDVNPNAPVYGPPNPHAFGLNDGITPLSSAIFLPPDVMKGYPVLQEGDLARLRHASDVRLARVFRNIDHVTFLDGRPPHRGSPELRDELHPEHGQRQIIDWMLSDLMNNREVVVAEN